MTTPILPALALAGLAAAQTPAHDRGIRGADYTPQPIERPSGGFLGDAFRLGSTGETWMIESIRLWAVPPAAASCPRAAGDQIEKIVLLGGMDNPPAPGQLVCDCHALVPIAAAALLPGRNAPVNPDVRLTVHDRLWQIDFQNVRWSIPGGVDALFSARVANRSKSRCDAAGAWSLASSPAASGFRLRKFDARSVPDGFAEAAPQPVWIDVQIWAHRVTPQAPDGHSPN
ncbi:MAG TPA: hypothetical protein VGS58_18810 [Candidatus Sulfopaludibacter sp.]|nr:hypothetical protein [Candidatus Sulfopaludibacter sp.]